MSKHVSKPVDMSKPPEDRHRRHPGRVGATPPAQAGRALGSRAARQRRDGERKMEIERRQCEEADRLMRDAVEVAVLDDEEFTARILAKIPEDARPAMRALLQEAGRGDA